MEAILAAMSGAADAKNITLTKEQLQMILGSLTNASTPQKAVSKKKKTSKDPNAPTRGKSPYLIWLWDENHGVASIKKSDGFDTENEALIKEWCASSNETASARSTCQMKKTLD